MNNQILRKRFKRNILVAVGLTMLTPAAFASTPWIGTADYKLAPGATGDEAKVGPFDTYDFGAGISLVKPNGTVANGQSFTGTFQTMVDGHFLNGVGLNVTQLDISGGNNFTGNGNGFELTFVSHFSGVYTSDLTASGVSFNITGGDASLYFDTHPNYSFVNDSGFTDGAAILSGSITDGLGSIMFPSTFGIGVEQVAFDFSGIFGGYNTAVYDPDTIGGGAALFSIKTASPLNYTPVITQVTGSGGHNTVLGVSATGGQLAELDGKLQLTTVLSTTEITVVPVPAAAWLFGSGLIGLLFAGKRKKIIG